jgi:hypothetical protein
VGLVIPARIQGEVPQELTFFGQDPHPKIGHEQDHPPDTVDFVPPYPEVDRHLTPASEGEALGRAVKASAGVRRPIARWGLTWL